MRDVIKLGIQVAINTGDPIKALCWKQPFASLMQPPWNKIETRTQPIKYNGLVLVVATAKEYADIELRDLCGGELALSLSVGIAGHDGYMNGAAIAIGHLWKCERIEALSEKDKKRTFIRPELWHDRYAWHFQNVFAIDPIPMKGFRGWRNVESELRAKIRIQ